MDLLGLWYYKVAAVILDWIHRHIAAPVPEYHRDDWSPGPEERVVLNQLPDDLLTQWLMAIERLHPDGVCRHFEACPFDALERHYRWELQRRMDLFLHQEVGGE